jgi:hypothetical protein
MQSSERRFSPAAERNRQPMLEVLRRVLPARGRALEIASGTGQHVAWFARQLPAWNWQPTDADPSALPSIEAWTLVTDEDLSPSAGGAPEATAMAGALANVRPPLRLDVCEPAWPVSGAFDAITCANMLHIAPWACCAGLMQGAARHLAPAGVLVTYGPFIVDGVETAQSNLAFDADLRRRDPAWGIRRLGDVVAEAARAGLRLREQVAMPANNRMLVFERDATPADISSPA